MTLGWHCPTMMMIGSDELAPWFTVRGERSVTVMVDAAVADAAITRDVRAQVDRAGRPHDLLVLDGPGSLQTVGALAERLDGTDLVIGIGGGALLDQAKLATLLTGNPEARVRVEAPQRSGLVAMPAQVRRPCSLLAVPTTLGTGAELSPVAVVVHRGGKRLVMADVLRPDAALLDPASTATLPTELVAEGVFEALTRVVGLYVGDSLDRPEEDVLAETVTAQLVRLGDAVADQRRRGRAVDEGLRMGIAKLSGLTHAGWLTLGRNPYGARGWYLANELSTAVECRKMTALAALLPPLWAVISDGDERWGSAPRLRRMWAAVRAAAAAPLPAHPAQGIAALVERWAMDTQVTAAPDLVDAVAARCARAWGGGLPMLGHLTVDDIRSVIAAAVRDGAGAGAPPPARPRDRWGGSANGSASGGPRPVTALAHVPSGPATADRASPLPTTNKTR